MSACRRFVDQDVVVTGGASGIGRAIADRVAAEGGRVMIADVDEAAAARTAAEIGDQARSVVVDLADRSSIEACVESIGVSDALINAAGVTSRVPYLDLSLEEWQRVMDVNVTGIFLMTQAWARTAKPGTAIVNVVSIAAHIVRRPEQNVYAVSKAAALGLTRSLAVSLASRQIRVNAVSPGPTRTPLIDSMLASPTGRRSLLDGVLMGRAGEPSEIAAAAAFLASEDSTFMTGAEIVVDGGTLVGSATPSDPPS